MEYSGSRWPCSLGSGSAVAGSNPAGDIDICPL